MSNANIAARLEAISKGRVNDVALVEYRAGARTEITFGDLARRVSGLAAGLAARGIRPGDGVLLFVPMSIDLYIALLAVVHAGATAVFVDAWADSARLDAAIAVSAPRAFIGTPKSLLLRFRSRNVRRIPIVLVAGRRLFPLSRYERPADIRAPAVVTESAPAIVTFTTGSTGRPRGVPRTHGMLWAQHVALRVHLGLRDSDVDMPTLPIFVLNNLACGVRSVLPEVDPRRPAEFDAGRVHSQMVREGVTTTSGSPAFFERLVSWCESSGASLPVRAAFTGGAPVLPALARRLAGSVVAGTAHVVFGATEVEPVAGIPIPDLVRLLDEPQAGHGGLCVGPAVEQLEVRLLRPTDSAIDAEEEGLGPWTVPDGEIGEITVSGDYVLRGYLHDDEANRISRVFTGGRQWFRTGDCAWRDRQDRLWLVGRLSQRVRRADEVIWPLPVELRALTCSFVRHAALIGVRDPALGQRAVLCVEVPEGLTAERERSIREAVAPWTLDEVIGLSEIPRDPRHHSKTNIVALRRRIERQ